MPALGGLAKGLTISFSGVRGQIDHGSYMSGAGKAVTEAGALRVAAIWIACTFLADEIASLALRIVSRDDKSRTPLQPRDLEALWSDDPNPDQTRFGIESSETLSLMLWGKSYTMLGWTNGGTLDVRWPQDPDRCSLERIDNGLRLKVTGKGELENVRGKRPEFCFVPLYTLPGELEPVSPVRMAAELAGLSLAYQETAANLMKRGLNPSAVMTFDEFVDGPIAKELSERLVAGHGGSGRAGGVPVVGGKGAQLQRLTFSMADAEFIAQQDHAFKVLLAMWRVPPTVAGMVDKVSSWGSGVAEFSRGLERFTLRAIAQRKQAALQKYVLRPVDPKLQARYIFDSLMSASPKERAEVQRTRLMMGATSQERILAQEDEPPFEPDETVYTQLSLATEADRKVARLKAQAEAYTAMVAAGVAPAAAAAAVGFDPASFESPPSP